MAASLSQKGRGRRGREEEDDDAMEVDGEEEGVGGAIDGEGTWSYDYSKVRRQYLAQAGKSKMDAIDKVRQRERERMKAAREKQGAASG